MAPGERLHGGLPGLRVGVGLKPGPLGFCLGMKAPQVHVMGQPDPVCLLYGFADSLQESLTDRLGVVQHRGITGRTHPFGALGLDRKPNRGDPNVIMERAGPSHVDGCKGAPNGRHGSVKVTLPDGVVGLQASDLDLDISGGVQGGQCGGAAQPL